MIMMITALNCEKYRHCIREYRGGALDKREVVSTDSWLGTHRWGYQVGWEK